jgi:hypothetical protein
MQITILLFLNPNLVLVWVLPWQTYRPPGTNIINRRQIRCLRCLGIFAMVQREQSRSDPNNDNQSRSMVSTSTNPKIKVYVSVTVYLLMAPFLLDQRLKTKIKTKMNALRTTLHLNLDFHHLPPPRLDGSIVITYQ